MTTRTLFLLWASVLALQVVSAVLAVRQTRRTSEPKLMASLIVSGAASILPITTFLLFLVVFVIGGSSNVGQLAGESGFGLWRLWFSAWPLLFLGNPLSFLASVIAVCLPPYPPRGWFSFMSRLCAVAAAGCAWYAVVRYFPDA